MKGWISGNLTPWNESVIYKTTDGGLSWQISYLNLYTPGVLDLYFVNENYGSGVGIHGVNMITINGGGGWSVLTQGFNNWLYSVHTTSEFHSWAVGAEGTILNTSDGYNWVNQVSGTEERFNSIYMVNDWVGYIVTQNGNIFKTNSGGIIPAEVITFAATVENNNVLLKWQTATETNNQGFQIERRKKLEARSEEWIAVSFVDGNGTTTEPRSYSFVDENLSAGKYQYRLKQIDFDGTFEYSDVIDVEIINPIKFSLEQNYPNPFNPSTRLKYSVGKHTKVQLKVFDILGNEIATLVNEDKIPGFYNVEFDAHNIASGVYFYRLQAGDPSTGSGQSFVQTKKMILLR